MDHRLMAATPWSDIPVTIGGRDFDLRLTLGAMRLAEHAAQARGIVLELLGPDGWEKVSRSANALLVVVWACLQHDNDPPTEEWLGAQIKPEHVLELQRRITLMHLAAFLGVEEIEVEPSDPPTAVESHGTESKPSDDSTSDSTAATSGA